MAKETIAIVGAERKLGSCLALKLAKQARFSVLLLSGEEPLPQETPLQILAETESEQVTCIRDGCWEADMIVLDTPVELAHKTADDIREVATQKIVFVLSATEDSQNNLDQTWEPLLLHAKLVYGYSDSTCSVIRISGREPETLNKIETLLKQLDIET